MFSNYAVEGPGVALEALQSVLAALHGNTCVAQGIPYSLWRCALALVTSAAHCKLTVLGPLRL